METTQIPFQSLSASDTRFLVAYLAAQGDIVSFAKAANLKLQEAVQWAFSPHINNALNQLHEMQTVEFQAAATAAKHTCIQILTSTLTQIVEFHEKNKDDPALRTKASARFGTLLRALSLLARVSGFKLSTSPAASPRAAKPKLDDPKSPASKQLASTNTPPSTSVPSVAPTSQQFDPLPVLGRQTTPPVIQLFNACGGARAVNPLSESLAPSIPRTKARPNRSS